MGPNGMQVIESASDVIKEQTPGIVVGQSPAVSASEDDDDDDDDEEPIGLAPGTIAGYNTADILSVVSDSAEQGLALLSNWLGLIPSGNSTTTTPEIETPAEEDVATETPQSSDSDS